MSRLFLLLTLLAVLAAPAGASAALPEDGSGFGISDPDHIPSRSLDSSYELLRPTHFRFIVPWDLLDDPGIRRQSQDRILWAIAGGATDVAISFGAPGAPVSGDVWIERVARFVADFTPWVDWWSPANEPNHSGSGWTSTPGGAAIVADYSARLAALMAFYPDDHQLSPDFHDDYGPDDQVRRDPNGDSTVELYVREFLARGGVLGDAVAWHPYGGVKRFSLESTQDFSDNALPPAPHDIWVTEVGALIDRTDERGELAVSQTIAEQDAQVRFITEALAAEPRLTRISYWHMRDHNPAWDSALVDILGVRRPAWYRWCAARHGGDAAHPDCAPPG